MNQKGLELWCAHLVSVVENLTSVVEGIVLEHDVDSDGYWQRRGELDDVKLHLASLKSEVEAK